MTVPYETPYHPAPRLDDITASDRVIVHRRTNVYGGAQAGTIFPLARLPSSAHIASAIVTSSVAAAVGLYRDGVAVAPDFILAAGRVNPATPTIEKTIWRALGMAEDPGCEFDVAATLAEDAPKGGLLIVTLYCAVPMPLELARACKAWRGPIPTC